MQRAVVVPRHSLGSSLALVAGNLVPLAGVMFFGWDLFFVMVVFWIDNVLVGFWTVLKIVLTRSDPEGKPERLLQKLGNASFFAMFYGFFALFHGAFVVGFFGTQDTGRGTRRALEFEELADRLPLEVLGITALTLFASRGLEFFLDYIRPRAYETMTYVDVTMGAIGRMALLHVVIIGGGGLAGHFRSPVIALVLLVVLKTCGDLLFQARSKPT